LKLKQRFYFDFFVFEIEWSFLRLKQFLNQWIPNKFYFNFFFFLKSVFIIGFPKEFLKTTNQNQWLSIDSNWESSFRWHILWRLNWWICFKNMTQFK
jgi:hypothetical protein